MGICQSKYRTEVEILLKRIRDFRIEGDYLTPMEVLRVLNIKNEVNNILVDFDSCTEYLESE